MISFAVDPLMDRYRHSRCSLNCCNVFSVDPETYHIRHRCSNDGSCEFLPRQPDRWYSQLCEIIDQGMIPLVSSFVNAGGRLAIELHASTPAARYVAISHVWAGGLGNFEENALPECQLLRIHNLVDNSIRTPTGNTFARKSAAFLSHAKRQIQSTYTTLTRSGAKSLYWIDTLCIPVTTQRKLRSQASWGLEGEALAKQNEYRTEAINSMAQIYAGATSVLVIDPELQHSKTHSVSDTQDDETLMATAVAPWMARSWTLQEGALAVDLRFEFADGIRTASEIWGSSHPTSFAHQNSIRNLWQQDILGSPGQLLDYSVLKRNEPLERLPCNCKEKDMRNDKSHKVGQFVSVWNELSGRSTTKIEDMAAILASMLGLSAGEVLKHDSQDRMRALLRSQEALPFSILLAPRASYDHPTVWVPEFPCLENARLQLRCGHQMTPCSQGWRLGDISSIYRVQAISAMPGQFFTLKLESQGDTRQICLLDEGSRHDSAVNKYSVNLVWFDSTRDYNGNLLGCFFGVDRFGDNDDIHVHVGAVFSWLPHGQQERTSHEARDPSLKADKLSGVSTLIVQTGKSTISTTSFSLRLIPTDTKAYPQLYWTRKQAFPYASLNIGSHQVTDTVLVFSYSVWRSLISWYALVLAFLLLQGHLHLHLDSRSAVILTGTLFFPIAIHFLRIEASFAEHSLFKALESRWVQQVWAASFWNQGVTAPSSTIARMHGEVERLASAKRTRTSSVTSYPVFALKAILYYVLLSGSGLLIYRLSKTYALSHLPPDKTGKGTGSALQNTGRIYSQHPFLCSLISMGFLCAADAFVSAALYTLYLWKWHEIARVRGDGGEEAEGSKDKNMNHGVTRILIIILGPVLFLFGIVDGVRSLRSIFRGEDVLWHVYWLAVDQVIVFGVVTVAVKGVKRMGNISEMLKGFWGARWGWRSRYGRLRVEEVEELTRGVELTDMHN